MAKIRYMVLDRSCRQIYFIFMYLRAIFCTFQISVDFYFVPVGKRGGAGEGEGARERGIECILYFFDFFGPKWHSLRSCHLRAQKSLDF
jgi:hypothetical protein